MATMRQPLGAGNRGGSMRQAAGVGNRAGANPGGTMRQAAGSGNRADGTTAKARTGTSARGGGSN